MYSARISGHEFEYRSGAGAAVVMVHGLTENSVLWRFNGVNRGSFEECQGD